MNSEALLVEQTRRTVRRLKRILGYSGSQNTDDFTNSLMIKWLKSGEFSYLLTLSPSKRHLSKSVRAAIIDRFRHDASKKRRGKKVSLDLEIPDDDRIIEIIEEHCLRCWLANEIILLESGNVDTSIKVKLVAPEETGAVLRMTLEGKVLRQVAEALCISVETATRRKRQGLIYLGIRSGSSR